MIERSMCLWQCETCSMRRYLLVRVEGKLICAACWYAKGKPWM